MKHWRGSVMTVRRQLCDWWRWNPHTWLWTSSGNFLRTWRGLEIPQPHQQQIDTQRGTSAALDQMFPLMLVWCLRHSRIPFLKLWFIVKWRRPSDLYWITSMHNWAKKRYITVASFPITGTFFFQLTNTTGALLSSVHAIVIFSIHHSWSLIIFVSV